MKSGAVVYAKDLPRMELFYRVCFDMDAVDTAEDYSVLESETLMLSLSLVLVPGHLGETIETSGPPSPRSNNSVKLALPVPTIEGRRQVIADHGARSIHQQLIGSCATSSPATASTLRATSSNSFTPTPDRLDFINSKLSCHVSIESRVLCDDVADVSRAALPRRLLRHAKRLADLLPTTHSPHEPHAPAHDAADPPPHRHAPTPLTPPTDQQATPQTRPGSERSGNPDDRDVFDKIPC